MVSKSLISYCAVIGTVAAATASQRSTILLRRSLAEVSYKNWPSYAELPLDPSYPTKAAWGVWGDNDTGGALNHITKETIKGAAKEIKSGQAFNLNLELSFIPSPINPSRKPLVHLFQPGDTYTDDVVTLNTQMSTQYDSLRHFAYNEGTDRSTWRWYNDHIKNYEEEVIGFNHTDVLGIQQAAEKGIAARGVLLDYKGWMDSKNETFNAIATHPVSVSDLKQVAEWQGLSGNWSKPGDVLLIRFGWIEAFSKLNNTEKQAYVLESAGSAGLKPTDEAAEWLWDQKFSLVGADNPAFELDPFNGTIQSTTRSFHEILISGWGTSIMEFVDTEELSKALRAANRSTFFLTVQTLNVRGGIASPPNAQAII
ncbi:hypothetical protein BU24DRAFT_359788 [Aaosphaeria arxii CBS 175.79]|uniref:Cyclase n=1 Tax=Aaosphaeria arxii CBS 175.79 TaxID=1450172 RepID=A0A6A5X7G8_9PLEO|nr:uncharacterized protein BU24DRAFT_359788 [Aaosphaeria arxii CBS 175.79]KAF2008860.1 hypothetical protein BU24DRAFT_359788 [Aaosphaeria arxii CBS 175.79]